MSAAGLGDTASEGQGGMLAPEPIPPSPASRRPSLGTRHPSSKALVCKCNIQRHGTFCLLHLTDDPEAQRACTVPGAQSDKYLLKEETRSLGWLTHQNLSVGNV